MAFEEAVKTFIFAMIGGSLTFAYIGFNLKDEHIPLRILCILLSVLLIPLSFGFALVGLKEQAPTPTAAQTDLIGLGDIIYAGFIITFLFVLGYFIIVLIKWILATVQNYKDKKLLEEKMITK